MTEQTPGMSIDLKACVEILHGDISGDGVDEVLFGLEWRVEASYDTEAEAMDYFNAVAQADIRCVRVAVTETRIVAERSGPGNTDLPGQNDLDWYHDPEKE